MGILAVLVILTIFSSITAVICFIMCSFMFHRETKADNTELLKQMDNKINQLSSQIMEQASKVTLHNTEKNIGKEL